jgi:hypothetical protein
MSESPTSDRLGTNPVRARAIVQATARQARLEQTRPSRYRTGKDQARHSSIG